MLKILDHLEEWIVASLIGAATVIIFLSVLHRYASGLPIPWVQDFLLSINMSWAQELCIYMFIWMAKFGAAYGVRTGIHVGVDVFINSLKDKNRAKFVVIGLSGGALFTGIIGTLGFKFVWEVGLRYAVASTFGFNWADLTSGPVSPDLFGSAPRIVPDVFSIPPGDPKFHPHRPIAASRHIACRRFKRRVEH
jgi:C4-dicarboxylate transporter DctQ subunit